MGKTVLLFWALHVWMVAAFVQARSNQHGTQTGLVKSVGQIAPSSTLMSLDLGSNSLARCGNCNYHSITLGVAGPGSVAEYVPGCVLGPRCVCSWSRAKESGRPLHQCEVSVLKCSHEGSTNPRCPSGAVASTASGVHKAEKTLHHFWTMHTGSNIEHSTGVYNGFKMIVLRVATSTIAGRVARLRLDGNHAARALRSKRPANGVCVCGGGRAGQRALGALQASL